MAEWLAARGITVDPSTVSDWGSTCTPRCIAAAGPYRSQVSRQWRVDETYLKIGKRWHDLFRAIDEQGQIIDGSLSDRRNPAAAQAFFEGAIQTSTVTPSRVTTDKAKCYPPALRAVLPTAEQRTSKDLNNALARDPQHLQGRLRPMRRFKTTGGASKFSRGHTLVRNLGRGCSVLTASVPARLRLATAWSIRAASL